MPFQPGQSGNPGGRPSKARQDLEALLDQVFKPARRKKVLERLVEDAEKGDHPARTLLLAYTYGKPVERQELSGPDGAPIEVEDARSRLANILARRAGAVDTEADPNGDRGVDAG